VYKRDQDGTLTTIVGQCGTSTVSSGGSLDPEGTFATAATLHGPADVALAPDGTLYISDHLSHCVRMVPPDGNIYTYVGTCGTEGETTNTDRLSAKLSYPGGLAIGPGGELYISHGTFFAEAHTNYPTPGFGHRVSRVSPGGHVTVFAGNDALGVGYSGDGGPANEAQLSFPAGLSVDPTDNSVYISDSGNHCIRKVDPSGLIRTVAGQCDDQPSGGSSTSIQYDSAPATSFKLGEPWGVTAIPGGGFIFGDRAQDRIYRVDPGGIAHIWVGTSSSLAQSFVEGVPARRAYLRDPLGATVGPDGTVYISQNCNEATTRPQQYCASSNNVLEV